ncbi:DUF4232 domain-containing protein [Streptomyces sp. LP05-1]|uniref:DUF4232 domain-containing protein n=1 Tax=Streptomyces pyxinae TaxID=2970734 RepID=A0ABT2CGS6_9ACTN|nr:DUF4232 domain-containing protein [Streptomyces sp. LP05-1]MCS0635809.1 DUF4232 domain-containing protein [Streptomyces sp. LP05-1]
MTPVVPEPRAPRPRRNRLPRAGLVPVCVGVLALTAAGCADPASGQGAPAAAASSPGSPHSPGLPGTDAGAPTAAAPDSSATGPAPASKGAGAGRGPGGTASGLCRAADLGISLSDADPGAGQIHYTVRLTNKGASSCTLGGFPGVSLLRKDGSVIGKPADREGASHGTRTLAPGKSTGFTLHTHNKGMDDGGCWEKPALLKVYPPGLKDALTLRTDAPEVCGDTFRTSAVGG